MTRASAPTTAPSPPDAASPSGSAVYLGHVAHHRHQPTVHGFRYPTAMLLLDLDHVAEDLGGHRGWAVEDRAYASFRRRDHHGDAATPLDTAIRATIAEQTGEPPAGPIRLLTQPRVLGVCFNPVTFAYAYDRDGATLHSVLAEVTNTPWRERHAYAVAVRDADRDPANGALVWRLAKRFHVSPFMAMDHEYRWSLGPPGTTCSVELSSDRHGERVFDARLELVRRPLDRDGLRSYLRRQPLGTISDVVRIYGQAARLALKRTPSFPHPHPQ
ncbi:MAG: DUF1365 domain-containing protein [Patulibacter sp.]|nr:DUF1365 domain-containing protein [Patulibacter sp.]